MKLLLKTTVALTALTAGLMTISAGAQMPPPPDAEKVLADVYTGKCVSPQKDWHNA